MLSQKCTAAKAAHCDGLLRSDASVSKKDNHESSRIFTNELIRVYSCQFVVVFLGLTGAALRLAQNNDPAGNRNADLKSNGDFRDQHLL
jgi:hypothetical protein